MVAGMSGRRCGGSEAETGPQTLSQNDQRKGQKRCRFAVRVLNID